MNLSFNVRGQQQVIKNMNAYVDYMDVGLQAAMENVMERILIKAKQLAPVDTGKLQSSITIVVRQMASDITTGHIEAPVYYAQFVELGTSRAKAQPFLMPAVEEGLRYLEKEIIAAHKRAAARL